MTGLPSQLGYQIVNDVCKKPNKLEACCCSGAVLAIWSNKLPVNIRAHISNMTFTRETYKAVFEAADGVFNSSKLISVAATTVQATGLDETLPAFNQQNQPTAQVAAVSNRGAGRGRGNRGGRGGRGNRGGSGTQSGGNRGNRGNNGQKPRGPRHSSSPPEACCERHYVHGADAWYCLEPHSCPWKDRCTPRN